MLHLLRNPDKLEKLIQELQIKRHRGQLSDPVTFEEAEGCHYLQAVMWEGVRLYPAIGSPLARVVPERGMKVDGKFVPGGVSIVHSAGVPRMLGLINPTIDSSAQSIVGSSAYIINRLPEIWGDDANEFKPERWLTTDKEKLTLMSEFTGITSFQWCNS